MRQTEPHKPDTSENSEPPSRSLLLFIGKSRRGHWVVRDQSGLLGGLFVSRSEAFRFALFENGHRSQAIIVATGFLELDMSGSRQAAANDTTSGDEPAPNPTSNWQLRALPENKVQARASSGARNA